MTSASVRIQCELEERNYNALKKLKLKKGDIVRVSGVAEDMTVSSVGKNYMVYLKGMGGISIHPMQIKKIIRRA
jgi:hypothetical protein